MALIQHYLDFDPLYVILSSMRFYVYLTFFVNFQKATNDQEDLREKDLRDQNDGGQNC